MTTTVSGLSHEFITEYAEALIAEHGLTEWKFGWKNAKNIYGRCWHAKKEITLSKFFAKYATAEEIEDTILHEIAHALVGTGHGHGPVWKAKAREIGANPCRTAKKPAAAPEGNWVAVCEKCGSLNIYRWRRSSGRLHTKCRSPITWKPAEGSL